MERRRWRTPVAEEDDRAQLLLTAAPRPAAQPQAAIQYRIVGSYFANNRRLAGSGTGARLQYADIDPSFLTLVDTKVTDQPVALESDSTKLDYLHPVAGSEAAKIGAGLFAEADLRAGQRSRDPVRGPPWQAGAALLAGIPSAPPGGRPAPPPRVSIADADKAVATLTANSPGPAHVILAVTDNGSPTLTSWIAGSSNS